MTALVSTKTEKPVINCHEFQQGMAKTTVRNRDSPKLRPDFDSACLKPFILTKLLSDGVCFAVTSSCLPLIKEVTIAKT